MRQGNDGTDRHPLSRRDVLKGAAAATVAVAAASTGLPGSARAASNVVKGYGVTTSQIKDWAIMEKTNGITMEFTGTYGDADECVQGGGSWGVAIPPRPTWPW